MVVFVLGANYYITFQRRFTVTFCRTDSIELESLGFRVILVWRYTPLQTQVFRHFGLNFRHGKVSVDFSCILVVGIGYNRTLSAGVDLQDGEQRMFFLYLCKVSGLCLVFTL